jgi:hypothetical protein
MDTQSRPELEDLVRHDAEASPYRSADGHVEHAVSLLHAQESWVADERAENRNLTDPGDLQFYYSPVAGDGKDSNH